jgi:phage gp46-like protein
VAAVPDIRLLEQSQNPLSLRAPVQIDLAWTADGYDETQALATSIIIALGSDSLANVTDPMPDKWFDNDRRGWWGDLDAPTIWAGWPVGCRMWTLMRDKITFAGYKYGSTQAKVLGMVNEAIQPFMDLRVISNFTTQISIVNGNQVDVTITLIRPLKPDVSVTYSYLWDEIGRNVVLPSPF